MVLLTQEQLQDLVTTAVRKALEDRYYGARETAEHFGYSLRAWRSMTAAEPQLLALAQERRMPSGKTRLRWLRSDVERYLRDSGRLGSSSSAPDPQPSASAGSLRQRSRR